MQQLTLAVNVAENDEKMVLANNTIIFCNNELLLSCQPRVTVTSCLFTKLSGTYDR